MLNDKQPTPQAIDRTIQRHIGKLRKTGVLTVRPGFEIRRHQLTGKAAIVATVHTKTKAVPPQERLPNSIADIPVDVREATPHQRLRAHDPAAAALTQDFGRPEEKDPTWDLEREMPSGRLLTDPASDMQRALAHHAKRQPSVAQAVSARKTKQALQYQPAKNAPLVPMRITTTLTAHVSPDAGFTTLQSYLRGVQHSLVIGMYDFTSGPILDLFEQVLTGARTLQLVLDHPPLNPTANQSDPQTIEALNATLRARAKTAWALTRPDPLVSAWMFPFAYHIKVIVRDGSALWLSSGNLNNSNQPDPTSPPKSEDRDWHVIIENPQLAKLFGAYLEQDFASAATRQIPDPVLADAVTAARTKLALETNPPQPRPLGAGVPAVVPARTFTNLPVTITPLLTPDNLPTNPTQGQYLTNMLKLIGSAQKSLFIQLQYIEAAATPGDYQNLLLAISARIAAGVDVRLIESLEFGEKWVEKMKAGGVDLTAKIRLQPNVHNKGFVVDSSVAVVSSQNFSPAGVRNNRDAGVIIANAQVAQYFEPVFLADWGKATAASAVAAKKAGSAAGKGSAAKKPAERPAAKGPTRKGGRKRAGR